MAWRIDEQVIRGEIDNRVKGRVTGMIWLHGKDEPVTLELEGNTCRDLAGHLLCFTNPEPAKPHDLSGFATVQRGVVGDMTASRKVKVLECTMEEFEELYKARKPFPWHWGNGLYLEWFSECNGRVVIESSSFLMEIDTVAAWTMSPEDEIEQRQANVEAMHGLMERMAESVAEAAEVTEWVLDEDDDDDPRSAAEAAADEEAARMDLLLDRIAARLEREGLREDAFERIMEEERARLRRERGEPEPEPPGPEEEAALDAWIDEMNAAADEALAEMDRSGGHREMERRHPLAGRCSAFGVRLHKEVREHKWLPEDAPQEHPLAEVVYGVMFAGPKLGGALVRGPLSDEWPPDPLLAGDRLVRLKKARGFLRDALRGLDAADEQGLAIPEWRLVVRKETEAILAEVNGLIREVRDVLESAGQDPSDDPDW